MVLDRAVKDNDAAHISLEDMAVYGAAASATNAAKIDLVYLYRVVPNVTFLHALVAPSAKTYKVTPSPLLSIPNTYSPY